MFTECPEVPGTLEGKEIPDSATAHVRQARPEETASPDLAAVRVRPARLEEKVIRGLVEVHVSFERPHHRTALS